MFNIFMGKHWINLKEFKLKKYNKNKFKKIVLKKENNKGHKPLIN